MPMEGLGLQKDWPKVVNSLRSISDIYERVNKIISFNTDMRLRAEALADVVMEGDRMLDLGCGPGVFSMVAEQIQPGLGDIVMIDILDEMLRRTVSNGRTHLIQGVFEKIPLRDSSINTVIMGFALRDSHNLGEAVEEIHRVTHDNGGKLAIVDLGKPDDRIRHILIAIYWRIIAPVIAFIMLGRRGLEVSKIYTTYRHHPRTSILKNLLEKYFSNVRVREKMMGGAILINAIKLAKTPPVPDR
jgi:ubiquinone/menaquinone biosynthesis C-methylase UbiE